ncbi:TPA: hypothetical protein O4G41_004692 [Vibrio alginolyticus]|uniref:hypothetical protein n=1 Tax=Vibrio alginolyticus TaxID=663 RepID=UPI0013032973|nr:hypothetical protein [Vibrio alginolyticus]ELP9501470.1 hypothetical protein [Vibrio alginolyticus]HCZ9047665.1 hypothetical protein [Vibrio alginolyticus]HCZ9302884.1 hypothetical protein [Vibrio alginolyticus]
MKSENYKGQVLKNALDCVNYLCLSVVVYYFCFAPTADNEFQVVAAYKSLNIWMWFEVIVFLGFVALSVVSASLVKVNVELFKLQKQKEVLNGQIDDDASSKQTLFAVIIATILCVVGYIGLGFYWGI